MDSTSAGAQHPASGAILTDPVERIVNASRWPVSTRAAHKYRRRRQVMADVYKENSTILASCGLQWISMRATKIQRMPLTFFASRSASAAQPGYRTQFTFEAAAPRQLSRAIIALPNGCCRAVEGRSVQRGIPAANGDAYAREGNDTGLRDFYAAR